MKKVSEDLYYLIKSLSKTEKSYFKKHSRAYASGERAYQKLFNEIDAQVKKGKGYDESKLKESLKGEKLLNQISVAKNYLYNLILKNLVQFNLDETDISKLHEMIQGIELLFEKALFDQCEKLLRKAIKYAYQSENYLKLYELLQWEKNLLLERGADDLFEQMDRIYSQEKKAVEVLKESTELRVIYGKAAALLLTSGYARDEKKAKEFKKLLNKPIMKSADMLSTFHNKTFYYDIFVGYYSFVRDFENYYKFLNENVKLYNENPTEIKKRRGNYILLIHNHLSGCLYLKKFEEYRKSIEEYKKYIKGLKKLSEYDKLLDILVRKHEILYYNARGEFYDGVEFITSYMPELNKVVDVFDQRELNFIYYSSAMNYFGAGKYKEAQYYLNLILNSGEPDQRKELFLSSKLMSIIINYELENTEYLDSLIRSTYRYLMSRKIEYKFENFVISFFKRVLNKITKDELFELFDESIYKINKLMKDPYEVSGAIYFDYVSWLESKLNNKEYGDIVREKALKHK